MDKHDAIELLNFLNGGTISNVPASAHYLHVGQENLITQVNDILDSVHHEKFFKLYLNADTGLGKTILLRKIQHIALEQNYVVSFVSAATTDIRYNKLETVYAHMMQNLEDRLGNSSSEILHRVFENLQHNPSVAMKLKHPEVYDYYRKAKSSRDQMEHIRALFNWLKGGREISWRVKAEFNVRGFIERDTCMDYLGDMCKILKLAGYNGIVLLLDEMESVAKYNRSDYRKDAYWNIADIHNNKWGFCNTFVVFAGTPLFYSGPTGIGEEPQVKRRIGGGTELEKLEKKHIAQLVHKLGSLFEIYRGCSIPDAELKKLEGEFIDRLKEREDMGTIIASTIKKLYDM